MKKNISNSDFENKSLFILDMDGTFYLGNSILDGSLEFINKLKASGRNFLFFTNNSSKSSEYYINKLKNMGLDIDHNHIATSGDVTISYIKKNYPNKKIFLLGTEVLTEDFVSQGIEIDEDNPDIVVVGFDTTLTYEKISKACNFISKGKTFLATHPDLNCPMEEGFLPDCGSICALITASTGVKPKYFGKPYSETLAFICQKTGCRLEEIVFVGDRLYTDIALGFNNGVTSILVLSGETKENDLKTSEIIPDFIYTSIKHIEL